MKISDIGKKYGVSKDTLYFYISKGLLIPRMSGKQYIADETFERDLQLILKYRDWGFQLTEIHSALSMMRKSPPGEEHETRHILAGILAQKSELISSEISRLETKLREIDKDIEELRADDYDGKDNVTRKIGVPLSMLPLLRCPHCGGALDFSDSEMSQTQIMNADISCRCGYRAKIRDGIMLTPNQCQSEYDHPDISKVIYSDVPDYLTSLYHKSYYWMEKCLKDVINQESVVLESHLNTYFYLQYELELLEMTNSKIILIDKYPEILSMYKSSLEMKGTDLEVLFIAHDGTDIPITPGVVDIFVDFFGSNEHQFFNDSCLIDKLSDYMASTSYVVGTYFSISGGRRSVNMMKQYYPEASSDNFNLAVFKENVQKAGFFGILSEHIGETSDTGEDYRCLGFIEKDEKLSLDSFLLKKGPAGYTSEQFL